MAEPENLLQGQYRILKTIGGGASGTVYLVEDLKLPHVRWAIKELNTRNFPLQEVSCALSMFEREKEILKSLNHPGVPKFIDSFSHENSHYIVMEHIEGDTLDEILKRKGVPLAPDEVIPWALQIAKTLEYLHTQLPFPVIFRDLKPSNIILSSGGKIKLIDFGIARHFRANRTKDTQSFGTPGFSPPEQYGISQSDARSDIFSFGATLYSLLTNADMTAFDFTYPPIKILAPVVPTWLAEMIMRCLSRNPGDRYHSATEIVKILELRARPLKKANSFTAALRSSIPHLPKIRTASEINDARMRIERFKKRVKILAGVYLVLSIIYFIYRRHYVDPYATCSIVTEFLPPGWDWKYQLGMVIHGILDIAFGLPLLFMYFCVNHYLFSIIGIIPLAIIMVRKACLKMKKARILSVANSFCAALIENDIDKAYAFCSENMSKTDLRTFLGTIFNVPGETPKYDILGVVRPRDQSSQMVKGWGESTVNVTFCSHSSITIARLIIVDKDPTYKIFDVKPIDKT